MAYVIKYRISFTNRQKDTFRVEILAKNWDTGGITDLEGAVKPFAIKNKNDTGNVFEPIQGTEATIEFWSNNADTDNTYAVSLADFYNDDESYYRVDFYNEQVNGQDAADIFLWSGFLVLDNCTEDIQDRAHIISLNATDNIGLLKSVPLSNLDGSSLLGQVTLQKLVSVILQSTNLQLPVRAYLNLFENTTNDRTVTDTNDFLQQTVVAAKYFQNSDFTFMDCYTVLEDVMTTFNATLVQSEGYWNIIRWPEVGYFNGAIPGTKYNFDLTSFTAITLSSKVTFGKDLAIEPINENQLNRILRPYSFAKRSFNFSQPQYVIHNSNLQFLPPFVPVPNPAPTPFLPTPFATRTVTGDTFYGTNTRYEDYHILYTPSENNPGFEDWQLTGSNPSYVEVVYDTVHQDTELDRYIVTPFNGVGAGSGNSYVQFNPIPVSKGDAFDFTLSYRQKDNNNNYDFWIKYQILTPDCHLYELVAGVDTHGNKYMHWTGPYPGTDTFLGMFVDCNDFSDVSNWTDISMVAQYLSGNNSVPQIPSDGLLIIGVNGPNTNTSSEDHVEVYWKGITLNLYNFIDNGKLKIKGQYNVQQQNNIIKNYEDITLELDDSPRATITGALLTNAINTFCIGIGDLYNQLTVSWHRGTNEEAYKLSQITTFEDLFIHRKPRNIVDGDFYGLRYQEDTEAPFKFVSFLSIIQLSFLANKFFIFGIAEFDFMAAEILGATLYELWDTGEVDSNLGAPNATGADGTNTWTFNYLYEQP